MLRTYLSSFFLSALLCGTAWADPAEVDTVEFVIQYDDGTTVYYSGRPDPLDTCGVWFEPPAPSTIIAGQFEFNTNMDGSAQVYIWSLVPDFNPDNYYDSDEPAGEPGPRPIDRVIAGPINYNFTGSGAWQEVNFLAYGYTPEDLDVGLNNFCLGYVINEGNEQPYYPSIMGDAADDRPYHSLAYLSTPGGVHPSEPGWWAYGIDWMLRAKVGMYGEPPLVALEVNPYDPPIEIPANGGSFDYNIAATNPGTQPVDCDVWCNILKPNGQYTNPVMGPINISLPGNVSMNRDRTQNIPDYAPAGTYSFLGYLGDYPAPVWASDSFPFWKLAAMNWGQGASDWVNAGEPFDVGARSSAPVSGEGAARCALTPLSCVPNPFNPSTVIRFDLPQAGWVKLEVFNIQGRNVGVGDDPDYGTSGGSTPTLRWYTAGAHEVTFDGSGLAAGIYLARLEATSGAGATPTISVEKMVLLK